MASLSGEFQTDLGPPDVLTICVEALDSIGWEIDEVTERQIVATPNGSGPGHGTGVTIDLREAGEGTDFLIAGSDSGELAVEDLADVLDRARDAIGERIERAEAPEAEQATSVWVPEPEPEYEPAPAGEEPEYEPATAIAPAPVSSSAPPSEPGERPSASPSWWDRHRRAVAIGVMVFIVGGAVGAAATGGDSDSKTVKRAAGKSKGASKKVRTEDSTGTETQSVEAATTQKTPDTTSPSTAATQAQSSGGASPASPAAPAPPRVAKCDPGYAPQCLDPNASDYDCLGEGDGPYYVDGPVTVIGKDPFKLDTSDHDGVGCE
jgi:hypothetical protein